MISFCYFFFKKTKVLLENVAKVHKCCLILHYITFTIAIQRFIVTLSLPRGMWQQDTFFLSKHSSSQVLINCNVSLNSMTVTRFIESFCGQYPLHTLFILNWITKNTLCLLEIKFMIYSLEQRFWKLLKLSKLM